MEYYNLSRQSRASRLQSGATAVSERPRVLLVDDNRKLLEIAVAVLSRDFEIVGAVPDGRAALEAAVTLQPDVIVLDITMPEICGLEVASRLKAAGSHAAVVFLTVHDDEEIVRAAREVGGVGYVLKPRLGSDLRRAAVGAVTGQRFASLGMPDDLW
jgi:CheY-like chemotaxis protein